MYGEKAWRLLNKNAASNIKSLRQHSTKQQLYGHLPPIMKTIQVGQTRHAEHCWRSKDELISDILQWTPSHGWVKAGRPARTYIQQLCAGTGCRLEDLPGAMNDRDRWWERVWEIYAGSTTGWFLWICYTGQLELFCQWRDINVKAFSIWDWFFSVVWRTSVTQFYRILQVNEKIKQIAVERKLNQTEQRLEYIKTVP